VFGPLDAKSEPDVVRPTMLKVERHAEKVVDVVVEDPTGRIQSADLRRNGFVQVVEGIGKSVQRFRT
jgi:hypothetical protein